MQFEIEFNADYKGKTKDVIRAKFKAFWTSFLLGLVGIAVGVFVALVRIDGSYIPPWERVLGIVIIVCGVASVLSSPVVLLFTKFNDGFFEKVRIVFDKNPDNNEWAYVLTTTRRGRPYEDAGYINLITIEKDLAEVTTIEGKTFFVPLSELSEEQRGLLVEISKEIRQKRIDATVNVSSDKK